MKKNGQAKQAYRTLSMSDMKRVVGGRNVSFKPGQGGSTKKLTQCVYSFFTKC